MKTFLVGSSVEHHGESSVVSSSDFRRRFATIFQRNVIFSSILTSKRKRLFQDFIRNHRFNPQTFQVDLSNLTQDEGRSKRFFLSFFINVVFRVEITRNLSSIEQSRVHARSRHDSQRRISFDTSVGFRFEQNFEFKRISKTSFKRFGTIEFRLERRSFFDFIFIISLCFCLFFS